MTASGAVRRIDPHVHADGSYDAREPVELVLEYALDIDGTTVVAALRDGDTRLRGRRTPIHRRARQYAKAACTRRPSP